MSGHRPWWSIRRSGQIPVKRWMPAHENQPWREGGFPIFGMAFPLMVITPAAVFLGEAAEGWLRPRALIYSRN